MKNTNEKMKNNQEVQKENELFDKILMSKDNKENDTKYINSNYFSKSLHNFSENISKNKINTDEQSNFFSSKKTRDKGSYIGILESYLTNSSQENNTNSKKEHYIDSDNINMDKNCNSNTDNLNIVKENAHSLYNFTDNIKKDLNIKQKVINSEMNQNNKQINSCENNNIVNKNSQTEEKSKYFISNISSIDNERNNNSKNKFLKRKFKTNEETKNDENNIINVEINNWTKINDEKDLEKSIFEVNYIKPNKNYEINQLTKYNDTENNINYKYNQLIQNKNNNNKSKSQKSINYINNDKENCFKNKINEYMNMLNGENKTNNKANKSCKMRLKILDRKIRSSKNKYNNFETEEKTINKLEYHKLKRYKNYSSSYLNKFQKKKNNNIYSTDINIRREAKINIIKNEINKMNSMSKDISDIKVNNTGKQNNQNIRVIQQFKKSGNMENIYRSIIGQNSFNNTKHLDNILNELNMAINKLPKYIRKDNIENIDKISKTSTSRTYQISMNNIINENYGNDFQNNIFIKENKIHFLECNEKNEKLKFESKVNNMNCTLNKLLFKSPDFNSQTMGTQPANIFNKYKSISKNTFLQKSKTPLFL